MITQHLLREDSSWPRYSTLMCRITVTFASIRWRGIGNRKLLLHISSKWLGACWSFRSPNRLWTTKPVNSLWRVLMSLLNERRSWRRCMPFRCREMRHPLLVSLHHLINAARLLKMRMLPKMMRTSTMRPHLTEAPNKVLVTLPQFSMSLMPTLTPKLPPAMSVVTRRPSKQRRLSRQMLLQRMPRKRSWKGCGL